MTKDNARSFVAGQHEAGRAVEILVGAFADDPTWSWIFPDPVLRPELLRILWQAFADSAAGYQTLWLNADATATAVWIPPDGVEMSEVQAAVVETTLTGLLGDDAPRAFAAMEAFEDAHPHHEPHYSLSLLGTDVAHRGNGLGLSLLADTLTMVDDADRPAYLEASNPANIALYERYGFARFDCFTIPGGGPDVTTMWRERRTARDG
jgi:ribosomal protein S18 acetylase RimI-like enzyme